MSGVERYPLSWPNGQPRTLPLQRRDSAFKVGFAKSRDDMLAEIRMLGGKNVIVSTNVPVRLDGLPYADMREPADPGVAVYFDRVQVVRGERRSVPYVIACDSYRKVRENLRAVGATVEALRSIQRHGASSMLEQAFAGFAALPAAGRTTPWWEVLGVAQDAGYALVRAAYLELVEIHHPDRGGSNERMAEINRAFAEASSR